MNLDEMESRLRKRVSNPSEDQVAKTVMYECLSDAYHDICDRFHFREVRTRLRFETDSTHNLYGIPDGYYEVIRARYADSDDRGLRLEKIGPNVAFDLDSGAVAGRPVAYALWGNEVQFYPPPDGEYNIELYMKFKPPALASPTDVPVIPVSWHMGIVLLGRWYYHDGGGPAINLAAATSAMQSFSAWAAGRPLPTLQELDDLEQAVEVPVLGRWSRHRRGDMSPDQWRTGGM